VQNVTVGGVSQNYSYTVTVIDQATVPPVPSPTFTDNPLMAQTTPVERVHITELRAAVGELRARYGLPAYGWTDATLTAGTTPVKSVHLTELRTALADAYMAAGRTPPTYPTAITQGTIIAVEHAAQLRQRCWRGGESDFKLQTDNEQYLMFGSPLALLGMLAACCALLGFPIYFFVKDKQRRGEEISFPGLVGAVVVGVVGIVAVWLFLLTKR